MSEIKVKKIYANAALNKKKTVNQWWMEQTGETYAQSIVSIVNKIKDDQVGKSTDMSKYASLYSNKYISNGATSGLYARSSKVSNIGSNRMMLNVVKSCVDTAGSKIAKMKPAPKFLTNKGDYFLQLKAKKLNDYVDGLFSAEGVYGIMPKVFQDSAIFGTGFIKVFHDDEKVRFERVLPTEILVDEAEAIYGQPRSMFQIKFYNREELVGMFPDFETEIRAANGGFTDVSGSDARDMVRVIEAWHLRSSSKSTDGKRIICIDGHDLYSEEYKKDFFPFVKLVWSESIVGYFGTGLPEELAAIQIEINKLLKRIQDAQEAISVPRIFIENSTKINSAHITNGIGSIIKYSGVAPTFSVAQAMSPEVYQHLENLFNKAYTITGVSMMAAGAVKPSGLDSGAALREFQDIESERFSLVSRRYEQSFLALARLAIDLSRDLYAIKKDLSVQLKGKKFIETIKWKDVDLEDDKFAMDCYPVSLLPQTPAGRLARITELMQAGLISKEDGLSLLDFPDIGGVMSMQLSSYELTQKILSTMVEENVFIPPEPLMNLDLSLRMASQFYQKCKLDDVPEERLQLIRDFIEETTAMIAEMNTPPAQPIIEEAPNTELAQPESMPTNELLPFAG